MKFETLFIAIGLGIKRNWHIFLAIIAGILVGNFWNHYPDAYPIVKNFLSFIGQAFIRVIQMIVIPLVCSAIVVGVASIGDNKQIGKFGKKMIFYYAIITILAVLIGGGLVLGVQPGLGVQELISQQSAGDIQNLVSATLEQQKGQIGSLFLNMIPQNPIESLAKGEMIPIIFFALIFSMAFRSSSSSKL